MEHALAINHTLGTAPYDVGVAPSSQLLPDNRSVEPTLSIPTFKTPICDTGPHNIEP